MGKALKTAGAIIGGAVLIATGVGALAGVNVAAMGVASFTGSLTVGQLGLISSGLSAVGGMLDKPKSSGAAAPTEWTANEDQPTPFAFGRIGVAGKIVHWDEYGQDNKLKSFVSVFSGAGPIKGFISFKAGDLPVSFVSNGGTAIGKYNRQMWRSWKVGTQPDTALPRPTGLDGGASMPQWGAAYRLSGKACDLWTLQQDSKLSVYPGNAEPKPLTVLEGIYGYDPRYDDTYPGGAGTCRLNDRSTWRYIDNPIIGGLNWALGMKENGQVVGGIGASPAGIDLPAFVECANIAQANAWEVSAWPDTSQDASVVLDQFLQAGGAVRARHAGKISCVSRGAPRASIVTITRRDTAGAIELDTGASAFNRLNTITPRFMSEARGWKLWPADPVTFAAYRTEDGGKRGDKVDYPFVPKVNQAAQLAAYDILDAREPFSGTIPLKPHLRRLKPGDCFDIDEPGFLLDGVKCMVLSRSYDPSTGEVRIAFRSETDGKHDLALGKTTTLPTYPVLTPADPTFVSPPLPNDWTIVVTPPVTVGGGQVPGFELNGGVSNSTATGVLVEWGSTSDGPWTQAYLGPPTVETIPITGVQPGGIYYIAVSYIRDQNTSERQVYGPYTAPEIAADIAPDNPIWGQLNDNARDILQNAVDDLHGLFDADEATGATAADLYDRLGLAFEIDPVECTALVREDVVFEGVGPGGLNETLVQTTTRLSAVDAVNAAATAQVLINAKAYTDTYKTEAALTFATQAGLGAAISGARGEWRSYADAAAAGAVVGLVTNAVLSSSLATARGQWESYATAAAASAVIGLDTVAAREGALALAKGQWESYATAAAASATIGLVTGAALAGSLATAKGQWEAHAAAAAANAVLGLDTVVAREGAIAATVLSLKSYTDSAVTTSAATLATQTSLNGVAATASLALSTANGNEAYAALMVDVGNRLTGMRINGVNRSIEFLAEYFKVTPNGTDGIYFDGTAGRFKVVKGGQKVVLAAASGVTLWAGPTSVADGSEVYNNGILGIGSAGAYFGGETLSRPFDSDEAGSGSALISLSSSFQDITPAISKQVINGRFLFWPQFSWQGSGAFDSDAGVYRLGIEYRILSTDPTGATGETLATGSVNRVSASSASFPAIGYAPTPSWGSSVPGSASGLRRLVIQARISFGASAGVSSRRLAGIYHS